MARIRYLKPDFFTDEDLAELPFHTRLFFAGLWCQADKAGRLQDRPKQLKVVIFPYDNVDAEKCLAELAQRKASSRRPFIVRYAVRGQRYIQILTWLRHQKPHHTEAESKLPPVPGEEEQPITDDSPRLGDTIVPGKRQFLDFVSLTDAEYIKLVETFGQTGTDERIAELNDGIGSKGYKYESHFHTILSWDRKLKRNGSPAAAPSETAKQTIDRLTEKGLL